MSRSSLHHAKTNGSSLFAVLSLNVLQSLDEDKAQSLRAIGINSIGELLHYKPLHIAQLLMAVHSGEIGHDILFDNYLDTAYVDKKPSELADLPIVAIEGIGGSTEMVFNESFGITTIRELSLFPPFIEAQNYLSPDPEVFNEPASAPEDLMPKILGNTSSIARYSSFVMDEEIRLDKLLGVQTKIRTVNPELLKLFAMNFECFLGYIAGFKQSWINMGTHLGEIIHSLALAPGESRNIAVIEWYRRQSSSRTEETLVDEQLTNSLTHTRALDEVTKVTAKEHQSGRTDTMNNTSTTANSESKGFDIGGAISAVADLTAVVGFPLTAAGSIAGNFNSGNSSVHSNNTQVGTISSSSSGNRNILGEMSQNITDSTLQNSSNIRSLWSTVVVSDEQSEKEDIQTRNVTNYNHSHALTVQYYEVLQKYHIKLELNNWTPVLYLPFRPLDYSLPLIQKYWHLLRLPLQRYFPEKFEKYYPIISEPLISNDLNNEVGTYKLVKIKSIIENIVSEHYKYESFGNTHQSSPISYLHLKLVDNSEAGALLLHHPFALSVLDPAIDAEIGDIGHLIIEPLTTLFIHNPLNPYTELKTKITLNFYLQDENGNSQIITKAFDLSIPYKTYRTALVTQTPVVVSNNLGSQLLLPTEEPPQSNLSLIQEIEDHFNQTKYGYTRFLISALEKEQLIDIIENLYIDPNSETGAKRLTDYVYPASVGVTDNYLIFKFKKKPASTGSDLFWNYITNLNDDLLAKQKETVTQEYAFLPTSGVFAEAILGRSNASEFVNPRRFWNWQDSPIPHLAPEIAAIQAGNHVVTDPSAMLNPNVPTSNLNIINPPQYALPTSLNAALQAVQNGNMFRDMSKSGEMVSILGKLADLANNTAQISGNLTGQAAENALKGAMELGNQVAGLLNNASNILDRDGARNVAPAPQTPTEKGAALNNLDEIRKNSEDGKVSSIDKAGADAMGTPIGSDAASGPQPAPPQDPNEVLNEERVGGIDVSHWQGDIDWNTVSNFTGSNLPNQQVEFAFIKATNGNTGVDDIFVFNANQAHNAGITIGYYHFAFPSDDSDAVIEAEHFYNTISQDVPTPDFPLVLDLEDESTQDSGMTGTELEQWVNDFINHLLDKPDVDEVIIYSTKPYLNNNLPNDHSLGGNPLWIARYHPDNTPDEDNINNWMPNGWETWQFWQYSETGAIEGINGNCDLNTMKASFFSEYVDED